jgi:ADP-ribose pyrophosphatase
MDSNHHRVLFEGKHVRVKACGHWEYAERTKARAGIIVVATTPADELLLVEQYRVPMQKRVIELPAGLAGDLDSNSDEEFIAAGKRELLEETGYEAADWRELAGGPPSPGLSNEVGVFYRAANLRRVGKGGGEGAEDILIHQVPVYRVEQWLQKRAAEGAIIDPKIYTGLFFLLREQAQFSERTTGIWR